MPTLRVALRGLLRTPGLTAVIVVSLGVGIGAAATAFSWVDSFVLRPLPGTRASNELVSVYTRGPGGAEWSVSWPSLVAWREGGADRYDLAASAFKQVSIRFGNQAPERIFGELVSGNFFRVLGPRPLAGRFVTVEDEAAAAQVVVLSERYWARAFERDPGVVGSQVTLNGQGFTVVGIAPAAFGGAQVGLAFDAWFPATTLPALQPGTGALAANEWQFLSGVARPAPGQDLAAVAAALETVSRRVSTDRGEREPSVAAVRSLSRSGGGPIITPLFFTLFGLASVILLIACANVANLMLVRASRRSREIGVRLALGASRWNVARQLLAESLVLAVGGGLAGLLVAAWGRGLLGAVMPALPFPVRLSTDIDVRVVAVVALLSLGTAILVGLFPALRSTRPALVPALRDERRSGSSRSLIRSGLVVAQVALSLVTLVSAGLFYRSLLAARQADIGVSDLDRVLVVGTSFDLAGTPDSVSRISLDRVLERIRALPGVTAASCIDNLPASIGGSSSSTVAVDGYEPAPDESMSVRFLRACPDYFAAMGIRVARGRGIEPTERPGSAPVVVVNEAFVARYWPAREPIGSRIRGSGREWTVVGVVPNVPLQQLGEVAVPVIYYPMPQRFTPAQVLVVRTDLDPLALVESTRRVLQSVDANLPVLAPRSMRESLRGALFLQTTGARVLGGLGLVAIGLATLGLYGVLSHAVSARSREIGIRIALGAPGGGVIRLIVGQAVRLLLLGSVVGVGLAIVVGNLIRSQLFGVAPTDPVTLAAVLAVLAGIGVLAAALPARRAVRIDPVITLKSD